MKLAESIIRFTQLTFVAIMLGLCGALLEQQERGGTPTRLNYSMFAAVLAALSLFYLIPATFIQAIRSPIAIIILDCLNFVFLICAGIALASSLGGKNCSRYQYLDDNGITNGGFPTAPRVQRCHEANALTAFQWFAAFAFLASLAMAAVSAPVRGIWAKVLTGPSTKPRRTAIPGGCTAAVRI